MQEVCRWAVFRKEKSPSRVGKRLTQDIPHIYLFGFSVTLQTALSRILLAVVFGSSPCRDNLERPPSGTGLELRTFRSERNCIMVVTAVLATFSFIGSMLL